MNFKTIVCTGTFALGLTILPLADVFAQALNTETAKFIEVTVTDSMELMPDDIAYSLSLRPDYTYGYDYGMPAVEEEEYDTQPNNDQLLEQKKKQEEAKIKLKQNEKKLIELLDKEKIKYSTKTDEKQGYFPYDFQQEGEKMKKFILKFKSFEQMDAFLIKINADIKYDGLVISAQYTNYKQAEFKILERAIAEAKKKAELVAKLTNVKLGNVQQFSDHEIESISGAIQGLMQSLPKYAYSHMVNENRTITLSKTIRVRFSIE